MRLGLRTFLLVCVSLGIFFGVFVSRYLNRESQHTPPDILQKITDHYGYFAEGDEVQRIIDDFHQGGRTLNVGVSQYCRAILVLADGDIEEFRRLADIPADPRDTLMSAHSKSGEPNHWFNEPFCD